MGEDRLKIVMYPWFAFGHLTTFLHLSNKLAERGHKIFFILPTKTQSKLDQFNLYPDLINFIPITVPQVEGLPYGSETTADTPFPMQSLLRHAMDLTKPTIESILKEFKPHFVFFDFTPWIPALARGLGVKSVHYCVISPAAVGFLFRDESRVEAFIDPPTGFPTSSIKLYTHEAQMINRINNGLEFRDGVTSGIQGLEFIFTVFFNSVTDFSSLKITGCCWAFSAVAATEGINQITTKKLISLSEQELVDCDTSEDQGCNGGLMDYAFEYIIGNKGFTHESNYPYEGVDGTCNTNKESSPVAKISGYEDVPANSESSLLKAVANQPVSVAIDASGSDFQFYLSGVFSGECGTELDHGVTAVGYGQASDGTKYWLVKNSWGASWGENGYIRMERDISAAEGICGIAMQSSYPTA